MNTPSQDPVSNVGGSALIAVPSLRLMSWKAEIDWVRGYLAGVPSIDDEFIGARLEAISKDLQAFAHRGSRALGEQVRQEDTGNKDDRDT